ncbi:MAG TPA: glycine oxidase ThiO [Thermomicrobiales bacterium]|nr:glycine oxidase ThiO [Thermomicrobiales bacterium]
MGGMAAGGSDVVVVGAGIAGCMLAYELAGRGARVTVLDRAGIGGEAAKAAAGILSPLIESEGPGPFLDLALDSIRRFPPLAAALREEAGEDVELVRAGALRVVFDEADEVVVRAALPWQRATGSDARWLDRDAALALEPGLAPDVRGAALCPDEYHVNSARLLHALALAAGRRGVAFRTGTPALGLTRAGDRATGLRLPDGDLPAGAVVLAGGAWTGAWARELGVPLPVGPVRGQVLVFRAPAPPLARIIFGPHGYLVAKPGGAVVAGTTEDRAGFATDVTAGGVATIARVGLPLVPAVAAATFDHAAAGLRPWSPDGLPLLGPAPGWRGVYVDSGHHRNGILLAPGSAALLADLLAGGPGGERSAPFAPARFAAESRPDGQTP